MTEQLLISSVCSNPTIERAFKIPTAFVIILYSMSIFEVFSEAILPAVYLGALWIRTCKLVTIICSCNWLDISLYVIVRVRIYRNLQCTSIGPQEVAKKPTYKITILAVLSYQVVIHSFKLRAHGITCPKQARDVIFNLRMGLLATYGIRLYQFTLAIINVCGVKLSFYRRLLVHLIRQVIYCMFPLGMNISYIPRLLLLFCACPRVADWFSG